MSRIHLTEIPSDTTPSAGQVSVSARTDSELYLKRDDGSEDQLLTVSGGSGVFVATDGSSTMTGNLDLGNQDIVNVDLVSATSGIETVSGTYKSTLTSQQLTLNDTTPIERTKLTLGRIDLYDAAGAVGTILQNAGDLTFTATNDLKFGGKKLRQISNGTASNDAVSVGQLSQSSFKYVSISGSDVTGNGSVAAPYQTVAAAIAAVSTGGTVFIYPGLYTEPTITLPDQITLRGFGPGTEIQNGFTHTAGVSPVAIVVEYMNYNSFFMDEAAAINGTITMFKTQGTILRPDNNLSVLLTVSESSLFAGSIDGGTNQFSECLVVLTPTITDGSSIFENSKFVAHIEAEGPVTIRTLDCELFGATEFINGTVVGLNTPTWQTDLATDYLGGYTGTVNKTLLATVPAANTTGFATVATSADYADLSNSPMTAAGQMAVSLETAVVPLTDAVTINLDASLGNTFTVTLGGNRTLATPTNPSSGQKVVLRITQDGTGGRTLAYSSGWNLGADLASVSLSTAAGATDYVGAIYNTVSSKWDIISIVRGY